MRNSGRLSLLIDFLNLNLRGREGQTELEGLLGVHSLRGARKLQREIRQDLSPLITLPDNAVLSTQKKLTPTTRSAMWSTYAGHLGMLAQKLNQVLHAQLEVRPGDTELWSYQPDPKGPPVLFPLGSEIAYVAETKTPNPALASQVKQGRGNIKTRWGKFVVEGQHPNLKAISTRKRLYGIVAESLLIGRFSKLRECRQCPTIFLANDRRKAFCSPACDDLYGSHFRMAKKRAEDKAQKAKERREKQKLAQEVAQRAAKELFRRLVMGEIKDTVYYNTLRREVGRGNEREGHTLITQWNEEIKKSGVDRAWEQLLPETQEIFCGNSRHIRSDVALTALVEA